MSEYNEILGPVLDILRPFIKAGATLNENSELVAELGMTSLQVMELVEQIEDRFDISFPLNLLPDIRTVHDLVQKLAKLVNP